MILPGVTSAVEHDLARAMPLPQFEDRLLSLPPRQRVVFGILLVVAGAAATVWLWGVWIWFGGVFLCVLGLAAFATGLAGTARLRRLDREAHRALAQWSELVRELELARQNRSGVERTLTRLGYREPEVRAWIRQQTGAGADRASAPDAG